MNRKILLICGYCGAPLFQHNVSFKKLAKIHNKFIQKITKCYFSENEEEQEEKGEEREGAKGRGGRERGGRGNYREERRRRGEGRSG